MAARQCSAMVDTSAGASGSDPRGDECARFTPLRG
jgi:hypothetical protein